MIFLLSKSLHGLDCELLNERNNLLGLVISFWANNMAPKYLLLIKLVLVSMCTLIGQRASESLACNPNPGKPSTRAIKPLQSRSCISTNYKHLLTQLDST